ncbi:MAG: beta-propeller fold lactonase family protein [Acidiferrobacter sp.]
MTTEQTTLILIPTGTHSLGIYVRDPSTGTIVDRGYVATGQGPGAIAATVDAQDVYVANLAAATISAYTWQSATNELVSLPATPVKVGPDSVALAISGGDLWVADDSTDTLSTLAMGADGALTSTGFSAPTNATVALLAGPTTTVYQLASGGITPYTTGTTGALVAGTTTSVNGIVGGNIGVHGSLYVITATALLVYGANSGGLAASPLSATLPSGFVPTGVTAANGYVMVSGNTSSGAEVVFFQDAGGNLTPVATPITTTGTTAGIVASPGGHYVYVTNPARGDLLAYTTPSVTTASTPNAVLRTRTEPGAPLSIAATVTLDAPTLYVVDQSSTIIATYPASTSGALGAPTLATTCNVCATAADEGPSAAVLASDGANLYVSDWASGGLGDVTTFPVGANNGALGTPSSIGAGESPMGIAIDPSGRYLYVANSCYGNTSGGNCVGTINGYTIANGALTAMSGAPVSVYGNYPMLITADPTGRFLYTAEFTGDLIDAFSINQDTGALTFESGDSANTGVGPWTIVIGPSGRHLYVSDNGTDTVSLYTINIANGALTPVSSDGILTAGEKPLGLVMGPNGRRLYVASQSGSVDVFMRPNPLSTSASWNLTPIQIPGTFNNAYGLAISANGAALYVIDDCTAPNFNNGNIVALSIPTFSTASSSTYPVLGTYQTGACTVQAVAAGGLD